MSKSIRKKGLNGQQQFWFDVHYILEDLDRIVDSLEELVECQKRNQ